LAKHKKVFISGLVAKSRKLRKHTFTREEIAIKRKGFIYEKICSLDNLTQAHYKARRGKAHYKEVKMVNANTQYYIEKLRDSLLSKTYRTSEYVIFNIKDKGKEREIYKLPYYPDRICQWAIMLQIEDIFVRSFIYDTYASIPNRGIHMALNRLQRFISDRRGTRYCLKFDIKKYFPSIDHDILRLMLEKQFKDNDLLWLLNEIIDSTNHGLPIGNYLSQYLSNFYLSEFDHWMKTKCRYYLRYMDDIVILNDNKQILRTIKRFASDYLGDILKLEIKNNWQIFPTGKRGIDFVGYRVFGDYTLLRKRIAKNIKKKCIEIQKRDIGERDRNSIMSYYGWLKHCDSYRFRNKHTDPVIRRINNEIPIISTT